MEEGDEAGETAHDEIGSLWLRKLGASEAVAQLVGPLSYVRKLTPARQGGPMSAARVRAWNEQAKVPGIAVSPLESYRRLLAQEP